MKTIGACYTGNGRCSFGVWAPLRGEVAVRVLTGGDRLVRLKRAGRGYWQEALDDIYPDTLYMFRLENERDRPDPASHFQPGGVHGPSQVIDHSAFVWEDIGWRGVPLCEMIIYELHVGTFSPGGTFDAVIPRLGDLADLGVNAIELMPVAQFPGGRNWGYDGACPFAVQESYGGPQGLKRLVNECHRKNIAVILDVVYNHLGPEGNYLWDFGPYFTEKYKTPWGWAINYDGAYSNEVRNYFKSNALHWLENYHIDALRMDAIHGITDMSARPFLQELAEEVEAFSLRKGRKHYLIAESDLNDSRVLRSREAGGLGLDAQWCDDFQHSVHAILTGERDRYYADFGRVEQLAKAVREGFVYSGQYSGYRKRNHGNSSANLPADRFVFFSQNHDQTGNRMFGERLSAVVSFESLKVAAGITLLSPAVPLLFMGEEYGEDNPFLYFVSHSDPALAGAIREGRKREFLSLAYKGEPPDPSDAKSFLSSRIDWGKREKGRHAILLAFYRKLIKMRKEVPALLSLDRDFCEICGYEADKLVLLRRWKENSQVFSLFNFGEDETKFKLFLPGGRWEKVLDSADPAWGGPGSAVPGYLSGWAMIPFKGLSFSVFTFSEDEEAD